MLKWVLLIAVVYLAFRWWSRVSVSGAPRQASANGEQMVKCAHCGVHFPKKEAVIGDDSIFCSEQHRDAWKQGR